MAYDDDGYERAAAHYRKIRETNSARRNTLNEQRYPESGQQSYNHYQPQEPSFAHNNQSTVLEGPSYPGGYAGSLPLQTPQYAFGNPTATFNTALSPYSLPGPFGEQGVQQFGLSPAPSDFPPGQTSYGAGSSVPVLTPSLMVTQPTPNGYDPAPAAPNFHAVGGSGDQHLYTSPRQHHQHSSSFGLPPQQLAYTPSFNQTSPIPSSQQHNSYIPTSQSFNSAPFNYGQNGPLPYGAFGLAQANPATAQFPQMQGNQPTIYTSPRQQQPQTAFVGQTPQHPTSPHQHQPQFNVAGQPSQQYAYAPSFNQAGQVLLQQQQQQPSPYVPTFQSFGSTPLNYGQHGLLPHGALGLTQANPATAQSPQMQGNQPTIYTSPRQQQPQTAFVGQPPQHPTSPHQHQPQFNVAGQPSQQPTHTSSIDPLQAGPIPPPQQQHNAAIPASQSLAYTPFTFGQARSLPPSNGAHAPTQTTTRSPQVQHGQQIATSMFPQPFQGLDQRFTSRPSTSTGGQHGPSSSLYGALRDPTAAATSNPLYHGQAPQTQRNLGTPHPTPLQNSQQSYQLPLSQHAPMQTFGHSTSPRHPLGSTALPGLSGSPMAMDTQPSVATNNRPSPSSAHLPPPGRTPSDLPPMSLPNAPSMPENQSRSTQTPQSHQQVHRGQNLGDSLSTQLPFPLRSTSAPVTAESRTPQQAPASPSSDGSSQGPAKRSKPSKRGTTVNNRMDVDDDYDNPDEMLAEMVELLEAGQEGLRSLLKTLSGDVRQYEASFEAALALLTEAQRAKLPKKWLDDRARMTDLGPEALLLLRIIRKRVQECMGIQKIKVAGRHHHAYTPLPPPPPDPDNTEPVDLQDMTCAWDHDILCPYNQTCAELFAQDLMSSAKYKDKLPLLASDSQEPVFNEKVIKKAIKTAFFIHLQYLYRKYKLQSKDLTVQQREAIRAKENQRKRRSTLYKIREADCGDHAPELLWIVERNGRQGTSSDEGGPVQDRNHPPAYIIHECYWRSAIFTTFLRDLDHIHRLDRICTPGAQFRDRAVGASIEGAAQVFSQRGPVPELPENCYNAQWLANLKVRQPTVYARLKVQPPSDDLAAWATKYMEVVQLPVVMTGY